MNNGVVCPIYFENHNFCGHLASINRFVNMDLGSIRTTIINNKPYFAGVDICRGLCLDPDKASSYIKEAVKDILNEYSSTPYPSYRGSLIPDNLNQNNLTPSNWDGGSVLSATPSSIGGSEIMDNFERELYFYLDIEVSHSNGKSMVKQIVRTTFVSESVLYMLIFRSRKQEAVRFKAWLAVEVLPNLRAMGQQNVTNMINNEMNNIMNTLNNINSNYDELKDSAEKNAALLNGIYELASRNLQNQNVFVFICVSSISSSLRKKSSMLIYGMKSILKF